MYNFCNRWKCVVGNVTTTPFQNFDDTTGYNWGSKFRWKTLIVDHNRDSLSKFPRTIHRCFKNKILLLWFDHNHIAVELAHPCAHGRD